MEEADQTVHATFATNAEVLTADVSGEVEVNAYRPR